MVIGKLILLPFRENRRKLAKFIFGFDKAFSGSRQQKARQGDMAAKLIKFVGGILQQ